MYAIGDAEVVSEFLVNIVVKLMPANGVNLVVELLLGNVVIKIVVELMLTTEVNGVEATRVDELMLGNIFVESLSLAAIVNNDVEIVLVIIVFADVDFAFIFWFSIVSGGGLTFDVEKRFLH